MEQMAHIKRPHLKAIEVLPDHQPCIRFMSGTLLTLDFHPLIVETKGLKPSSNTVVFDTTQLIPYKAWESLQR